MSALPLDVLLLGVAMVGAGAAGYRLSWQVAWLGALIDAFDFVTPTTAVGPSDRDVLVTEAVAVAGVLVGAALIVVFLRSLVG